MSLILDYEMTEHFGGPIGGAGAVPEVEFQRHLLCYEARHHAEAETAKRPENASASGGANTSSTVTHTQRRKRAPKLPDE